MGLELSQLGRRDGTRGWRNSAELREQVWDKAGQEGEERNAKRKNYMGNLSSKGNGKQRDQRAASIICERQCLVRSYTPEM